MDGMREAQPWFDWLMLALAMPVQFYVGWQYYVGRVQGFAEQIREHGCADRDGFLCRVFLFTANHVWLADGTCLLRDCGSHHHADQTWKISGSACQGTYLRSDQEIDGIARQDRPRHS